LLGEWNSNLNGEHLAFPVATIAGLMDAERIGLLLQSSLKAAALPCRGF
jgi:hypothetical protein